MFQTKIKIVFFACVFFRFFFFRIFRALWVDPAKQTQRFPKTLGSTIRSAVWKNHQNLSGLLIRTLQTVLSMNIQTACTKEGDERLSMRKLLISCNQLGKILYYGFPDPHVLTCNHRFSSRFGSIHRPPIAPFDPPWNSTQIWWFSILRFSTCENARRQTGDRL